MSSERYDDPTEVAERARAIRDEHHGSRVTYSPKVFIPLTKLCRDRCGYCTFAQPPARLEAPYMTSDEVLDIARAGARHGCHEALFTLGERPELRYPVARDWLDRHGYASTVDYVVAMARLVLDTTGLLPHANTGAMSADELATLRRVAPSQGMMIESLRADLDAHRGAPDKTPERRLATLEAAGELQIPYTTGILVGIGEDRGDRIEALEAIAESHRRWGHVHEVIVQNFLPKPGTAMQHWPPCARLGSPRRDLTGPRDPPAGGARAGPAQSRCRLRRAAAGRHRRLGRRVASHRRSREPRAPLAAPGPPAGGDRGGRSRAGPAAHRPPVVRAPA